MDILYVGSVLLYDKMFKFYGDDTDKLKLITKAFERIKYLEDIHNNILTYSQIENHDFQFEKSKRNIKKIFMILEDVELSPLTQLNFREDINKHIDFQAKKITDSGRNYLFNQGGLPRFICDSFDDYCKKNNVDSFDKKREHINKFVKDQLKEENILTNLQKSIYTKFEIDLINNNKEKEAKVLDALKAKKHNLDLFFKDSEIRILSDLTKNQKILELIGTISELLQLETIYKSQNTVEKKQVELEMKSLNSKISILFEQANSEVEVFIGLIKGISKRFDGINVKYQRAIQKRFQETPTGDYKMPVFLGKVVLNAGYKALKSLKRFDTNEKKNLERGVEKIAEKAYLLMLEKMWSATFDYKSINSIERFIYGYSKILWFDFFEEDTFANIKQVTTINDLTINEIDTSNFLKHISETNESFNNDETKLPPNGENVTLEKVKEINREQIIDEEIKFYSDLYKDLRKEKLNIDGALIYLESLGDYNSIIDIVYEGDKSKYAAARKLKEAGRVNLIKLELIRGGETASRKIEELFNNYEKNSGKLNKLR